MPAEGSLKSEASSEVASVTSALDQRALAQIVDPLCDALESGLMLVDGNDRIIVCSLAMAVMFGHTPNELIGLSIDDFNTLAMALMDNPPKLFQRKGLIPTTNIVLCEEFELSRPTHTVARWVSRRVRCPHYAAVAVATDITADVELTNAYERMALTDKLTGLANRRGIERAIYQELLRLRRYQTPISFILFDIDHFKTINDLHGHSVGDEVLRQVASAMTGAVRETDTIARWGGEEFLVALPETPYSGALVCAEKIRSSVERLGNTVGIDVTISGGVYQPGPGESVSELLARADERLYQAKKSGRNRVC
jgi:diguanylate cyclase (GGDEF)-like protein